MNNSPSCELASDLIAFLYDEANESEKRNFELHLKECAGCREEVMSFGLVRESITAWKDEALSGFVSTPLATSATKKSALGAVRQFFDLSPLWLKGATTFAVIAFFVLAVLAILNRTERDNIQSIAEKPKGTYTQQDVDRLVKEALANHESSTKSQPPNAPVTIVQAPKPKQVPPRNPFAKSRRPLTRAEREQLAADLRLLSTDEAGLNLLGDRINQ
ncbi:MAG TPA: zf-HC2 domain-containing protein [Pyrinomonadaceae bacterium]|nr:zf-HC2 domain-containing protein [Pyrinomonadaceae bacterium]